MGDAQLSSEAGTVPTRYLIGYPARPSREIVPEPAKPDTLQRNTPIVTKLHRPIFTDALAKVAIAANGDPELQFALIRKMAKGFSYEERSTPAHRKRLKRQKYAEQNGLCAICCEELPKDGRYAELDRSQAHLGENTRLVHHDCHIADQEKKNYA